MGPLPKVDQERKDLIIVHICASRSLGIFQVNFHSLHERNQIGKILISRCNIATVFFACQAIGDEQSNFDSFGKRVGKLCCDSQCALVEDIHTVNSFIDTDSPELYRP
jgi:hypothetical protein